LNLFHPTFYPVFLPPLFQVFPEAEVFVLVFAAAALSAAAAALSAAAAVLVAEPEVFALFFAAAALSAEVAVLAAEPEVVFVVDFDVSEPQASVDIAVAFVVLVPVSVVVVEVDNSGRPKFLAFPNVDHFASPSSFVEVVG
jgi:hypothetical protein